MISRDSIKSKYRQIVTIDEPPHRISLAFAVGIFIAFSPTIGLHTLSAVAAAWFFKLNLPVMIAGTLVNNPWTITLVYGSSICFGSFVLGNNSSCSPEGLGKEELVIYLKGLPIPFIAGTIVLGILAAFLSYFILLKVLVKYKNKTS